jgi:hypothetical protein
MTDERGTFDASSGAEHRGLSRRQMIKASAVAGAAAWTAPVIIDSLSSPAAAGSGCNIYWVKLCGPNGDGSLGSCFSACPGGGYNVSNAKWAGSCSHPGGCDAGDGNTKMPSVSGTGPYTVTLPANCTFSSSTGSFSLAGRYGDGSGSDTYSTVTGILDGATSASINKTFGAKTLAYIYVKFCSTTP